MTLHVSLTKNYPCKLAIVTVANMVTFYTTDSSSVCVFTCVFASQVCVSNFQTSKLRTQTLSLRLHNGDILDGSRFFKTCILLNKTPAARLVAAVRLCQPV